MQDTTVAGRQRSITANQRERPQLDWLCVTSQRATFQHVLAQSSSKLGQTDDLTKVPRQAGIKVAAFTSCQPETSLLH